MRRPIFNSVVLLATMATLLPGSLRAADPELKSIYPCGCQRGETIEVTLNGTDLKDATQLYFSCPGISAQRVGDAIFKVAVATDVSIDVCELWVVTANGIVGPRRFAIDELPTLVEKEENESRDHAQAISVPSVIDAKLDRAADLDWYCFEGAQGDQVTITCRSDSLDGTVQASMMLIGPGGDELSHSTDFQLEPQLSLRLPHSGKYALRVCDRAYRKDDYSFYRLEVKLASGAAESSSPSDDDESIIAEVAENETMSTAQPTQLPFRIAGNFSTRGDIDWYRFDAKKDQSFGIESSGERLGQRMDLDITVHDATGKSLLTLGDVAQPKGVPAKLTLSSLDAAGTWKAPADGTFYLAVRDLYGGSVFGSDRKYELAARESSPSIQVIAMHPHDIATTGLSLEQGGSAELQLIAIRSSGFDGPIHVRVDQAPEGISAEAFSLSAKETSKTMKLSAADNAAAGFGFIRLVAEVVIDSQNVMIDVQPRTIVRGGTPIVTRATDATAIYVSQTTIAE